MMASTSALRPMGWLSVRDAWVLATCVVFGVFWGIVDRGWPSGPLAAISVAVILGLVAQIGDLRRGFAGQTALTSQERWGWRFAIVWRLVVVALMFAYFLVRWLVLWKVLASNVARDFVPFGFAALDIAVLLMAILVAIGSNPCLIQTTERRRWAWLGELLVGALACVLLAVLLRDRLLIPALVHITIAGIEMAQPLQFSSESLAACDTGRILHFFDVTTAGAASVLVSLLLVRFLAWRWPRGLGWRIVAAAALVASLVMTGMFSRKIALVEVPDMTPALASRIPTPNLHEIMAAAALALLLVGAVGRRWSTPRDAAASKCIDWRRCEYRYYHERRLFLWPTAAIALWILICEGATIWRIMNGFDSCGWLIALRYSAAGMIGDPVTCLCLALGILAVQCALSRNVAAQTEPPPLSPALFLLVGASLLAILVFGIPILGAWGFALCFNVL
ncbi:MAG: hypothetical protein ABFC54_04715 [Thermoguttaceae bacterium]